MVTCYDITLAVSNHKKDQEKCEFNEYLITISQGQFLQ